MSALARFSSDAELFQRFVEVMLPNGGCLMALAEAYFDESGSHDGSKTLCVAGYILHAEQARLLTTEWNEVLAWKDLPYFHMVDCAHGNGVFAKLSRADRIQVAARMIAVIKRRTAYGLAVSVDLAEFKQEMDGFPIWRDPYTACAHFVLGAVGYWTDHAKFSGDIAYFFESGHASAPLTSAIMDGATATMAELRDSMCYGGHAFVKKERTPAVQAADFLAWQWYTDVRHMQEGRPRRKDLESLFQHTHAAIHLRGHQLRQLKDTPSFRVGNELVQIALDGRSQITQADIRRIFLALTRNTSAG
jgi:hypothetical protein